MNLAEAEKHVREVGDFGSPRSDYRPSDHEVYYKAYPLTPEGAHVREWILDMADRYYDATRVDGVLASNHKMLDKVLDMFFKDLTPADRKYAHAWLSGM